MPPASGCRRRPRPLRIRIEGPGELVATDNGDPTDMTAFSFGFARVLQRPRAGHRARPPGCAR